jgi:galactokinase
MKNSSENFKQLFDTPSTIRTSSYARVNLIGEHTDYTGGYVMPYLLPYKITIFLNENSNENHSVFSEYFNESIEFNDFIKSQSNNWIDYIKGCLSIFLMKIK